MNYRRLAFPVSLLSVASLCGVLVACSSSSTRDGAVPVDPGTTPIEAGPPDPDGPHADGGPDAPVVSPVAPGAVDPSFGTKGITSGTTAATPTIRFSRDGRTVVFEHKTNVYATLTALLANGTPDKVHGKDGLAEVLIPNAMNHSQSLNASARIEDDGSVFVSGGMKQDGVYYVPFVGRITTSSLDLTFGNSSGLWTFPDVYAVVGNVLTERNSSGAATGYYTVVSFSSLGGAGGGTPRDASTRIYHLTAAGITEAAYGAGKGYFELPSIDQVVLDASGLPVVFSATTTGTFDVRRLTKAGAVDTTYGTAGIANIAWTGQTSFSASPIALAKGGLLVALGGTSGSNGTTRIVRLAANGAAADAFAGVPTRDIPNSVRIADELADGRLLVTAYDSTTESIERWLADGKPDTTFGQAGRVGLPAIAAGDSLSAVRATSAGATMVATTRSGSGSSGSTVWTIRRLGP